MELCCRESKSEDEEMNQHNYFSYLNLKKTGSSSTLEEKSKEEVITVRRTRRVLYKFIEHNANKQKGCTVGEQSEVEEGISSRRKKELIDISIQPNNETEKNSNNFEGPNSISKQFEDNKEEQELTEDFSEEEFFNGFSDSDRRKENSNSNQLSETEVFLDSLKLKKVDISPDEKQALERQHSIKEKFKSIDSKNIPYKKRKIVRGFLSPTDVKTTSEFSRNLKEKGFLNEEFKVEIEKVPDNFIPKISENSHGMHTSEKSLYNLSPHSSMAIHDSTELMKVSKKLHLLCIPKRNTSLGHEMLISKINNKKIETNSTSQVSLNNKYSQYNKKNEEFMKAVDNCNGKITTFKKLWNNMMNYEINMRDQTAERCKQIVSDLAAQCEVSPDIEPKVELVEDVENEDSRRIIENPNEVYVTKQKEHIGDDSILEPIVEVKVEEDSQEEDSCLEKSLGTQSLQLSNKKDVIPKKNLVNKKNEQQRGVTVEQSAQKEKERDVSQKKTRCSLENDEIQHVSHTLTKKDEEKPKLSPSRKTHNILNEKVLKKSLSFPNSVIAGEQNESSTEITTEESMNCIDQPLNNPLMIVDTELTAKDNLEIKTESSFSEQEQIVKDDSFNLPSSEMEIPDFPAPNIMQIEKSLDNQISQNEEIGLNYFFERGITIRNLSQLVHKEPELCNDFQIDNLEVKDEVEEDIEPKQFEVVHYDKTPNQFLGNHIRKYCNFCNVGYINEFSLQKHMIRCKSNPKNAKVDAMRIFYCKYCNFGIASEICFEKHEENCQKELLCGRSTVTTAEETKKNRPKGVRLECPFCDYTSCNVGHMTVHRRTHDNVPMCACDICLKGFCRFDALQRHMFKHIDIAEEVKEFGSENVCNGGAWRTTLKVMIKDKPYTIQKYQCSECKYVTTVRVSMEQHFNSMHLNIVSFRCSMCPFTCKLKTNLKQHLNWHLREKVYRCSHCPYETINKSYIKKHENQVHLKAISYNCSYCDFKTYRKENLKTHINSRHLKEKKFCCDECDYFSYVQSNLIAHVKGIHQGIKRRRK